MITQANELLDIGNALHIKVQLLTDEEGKEHIHKALDLWKPFKTTGHLGIGHDTIHLPIDMWEFSYMEYLCQESGYVFFEQTTDLYKKTVVKIQDIRALGKILEKEFGMEYFLTNEKMDFLIAVNWYTIEVCGAAKRRLEKLLVDI